MSIFQVKGIRKVVVAERTPKSAEHFSALQDFAVFQLELDLIPITENTLHVLLVQMVRFLKLMIA